jgi:S-DNA-T family DNA segregation ATPase FtsK/SpoIIIE
VVLWGVDMKRGLELAPWRAVLDRLATTDDGAVELLTAANRVLDARAVWLAERGRRKWEPTPDEPALVVLVDELAELDAEGLALLERLARLGRAAGIILVTVTQRPSAAALGGLDARTQMTARIALGVVEARDAELILGAGRYGAERPALDSVSADVVERRDEPSVGSMGERGLAPDQRADATLVAALDMAPSDGLSAEELASRVGRSRAWVFIRVNVHEAAGRVARLRRGRWIGRQEGM